MKRLTGLAVLIVLVVLVSAVSAHGGRPLSAELTGANEVGGGDPDGSGFASVTLNQGLGEVCFEIEVSGISTVVAAHIHTGAAGVNGPPVVNFNPVVNGLSNCVSGVDAELSKDIRQNPALYYVNVHSTEFPGGAVRGQLSG